MRQLLCLTLCLAACTVATHGHTQTAVPGWLKGTWVIDYDRTLENVQSSSTISVKEAATLPGQLKLLRGLLKLQITDRQVVTFRGDRKESVAYQVEEINKNTVLLTANARGRQVILTFTLQPGGGMHMGSSATDDMDYFLWKKAR